jgi:hypothetical protein
LLQQRFEVFYIKQRQDHKGGTCQTNELRSEKHGNNSDSVNFQRNIYRLDTSLYHIGQAEKAQKKAPSRRQPN